MVLVRAFTSTVTKHAVTSMKPGISCSVKNLANGTCELLSDVTKVNSVKKVAPTDGGSKVATGEKKLMSTLGTRHVVGTCPLSKPPPKPNCLGNSSAPNNQIKLALCNKKLNSIGGSKRKTEEVLECLERKKLRMDAATTLICYNILTDIMNLEQSGPFHSRANNPAWGLDNYFDTVKKPKDLKAIKEKLMRHKYLLAEQFEADVKRTISTVMYYNSPGNQLHESAKELLRTFDRLWEPVRMRKNYKELFKPSVERQQSDLKTVKDGEPTYKAKPKPKPIDSLSSKTNSGCSGPESQSGCPMLANVKCAIAPEKKIANDNFNSVKVPTTQRGSYDQGSDKEYQNGTRIPTTSGSLGATTSGGELSPSSALRAAKLMDRFSATILKAKNYTLSKQGGETDTNAQNERPKLQMRQHEEKVRAEAKAVKSVARSQSESILKKQLEAKREASRIAIDMMEKTAVVDDNWKVLKDLEVMIGQPLANMCLGDRSHANASWSRMKGSRMKSPLERLGLYIKEEYKLGNENDYAILMDEDCEEGQII